jgi:hypothetical protein
MRPRGYLCVGAAVRAVACGMLTIAVTSCDAAKEAEGEWPPGMSEQPVDGHDGHDDMQTDVRPSDGAQPGHDAPTQVPGAGHGGSPGGDVSHGGGLPNENAAGGGALGGGGIDASELDGGTLDGSSRDAALGPDPNKTYFAEVTANGSGCPEGSWSTRISADGLVFTTTFSAYEAVLGPTDTQVVKDCQLSIKLHSPNGMSYALASVSYSGFALLDEGVVGEQQTSAYFQGQPLAGVATRTALVGPHDAEFVFKDDLPLSELIWSACGAERDLNVLSRFVLQSARPGAQGYINLLAADGAAQLIFRLATRECQDAGTHTAGH